MKSAIFLDYINRTISIKLSDGTYLTGLVERESKISNSIKIKTLSGNFVISCDQIISFKIVEERN